jgi:predicted permease
MMNAWNVVRLWLGTLWRRRQREDDLNRELQSHLELEAAERQDAGLSSEESHYAAQRAFGNTTIVVENVRAAWGFVWLERLSMDVRFGARSLRKSPGSTSVAILTLALGIGANTAIFSVVNALMLRPLPFSVPDQLVRIYSTQNGVPISGFWDAANPSGPSAPDVRDFAESSHSFEKLVVYDWWRKNVSFGDSVSAPEEMHVGLVPAEYFEILDVKPIIGRLFTQDENQEGKNYVAAITARLWNERYSGDKAILGRKLTINDESYSIVAVMPDVIPEWMERSRIDVWTPFAFSDVWAETSRGGRGYSALGRLKTDVTLASARSELSAIAARLAQEHPIDEGIGVALERLADTRAGAMRSRLFLLMGAVVLILLIACVNLGNLLLGRGAARQRELTLRAALGAGRGRLIQQLLIETLLLSLTGGVAGLVLAEAAVLGLAKIQPADLSKLGSVGLDWRVVVFTLLVSLVTSLLFGLAPALTGTRLNLVDALKEGGRSGGSRSSSQRLRSLLVVTEMAMSLTLLVGASLLVQSIARLQRQDLGIRQDHLMKGHLYLPRVRYPDPAAITRFCDQLGDRIRGLPGVMDASVTTIFPPNNGWPQMLGIPGRPVTRLQDIPQTQFGLTDDHFVKTCGIRLIRGRDFAETDAAATSSVALINEEFERRYFPREDPIGRQIHIGPPSFLKIAIGGDSTVDAADVSIVGVIGNFRNVGLGVPPEPQILCLYSQHPMVNYGFKEILTRTTSEPRLIVPEMERELQTMDPDMPLSEVQTIGEVVEEQTGGQRFTTALLASFAVAGLGLAIVGIYGVVSFLVTQRDQELAVRIALGAGRANVLWLVLRQSLAMAAGGAAIGLVGAWSAQKLMSDFLFGISAVDPTTFACAAIFLMVVAAIASVIPGSRVVRIDPAQTLRQG